MPEFVGHGEGDAIRRRAEYAVAQQSIGRAFHATGASACAFTALAEEFSVSTVSRNVIIPTTAHDTGPAIRSMTSLVHSRTTLPYLASN